MITQAEISIFLERLFSHRHIKFSFRSSKQFFSHIPLQNNFNYEDIEVMEYLLGEKLQDTAIANTIIAKEKMSFSYRQIERKIPFILTLMERNGIKVSPIKLHDLSKKLEEEIAEVSKEIFSIAGEEFNINSPKQVNDILFTKLKLKGGKKTSTGELSTNSSVLDDLAFEGEKIAELLIEARHLYKLQNTYVSVLIEKARETKDNRIRTSFSSTSTITGRLNSKNPNLQNLPAKTAIGMKIKQSFEGESGYSLVSFDYSQIELRILSHIANINTLKEAFRKKEDIHITTASAIFNLPPIEITPQQRNSAKTINFGIIYGLSGFALARNLKISIGTANEYIEEYLQKYKGVKSYMDNTMEEAKKNGFVRTILGKKCYLEGIDSSNFTVRGHALRAAINAPIQGSAADLIKKAMINISEKHGLLDSSCKMLLQIHDELVFEIKNDNIEEKTAILKKLMENAIPLSIPIVVNAKILNQSYQVT